MYICIDIYKYVYKYIYIYISHYDTYIYVYIYIHIYLVTHKKAGKDVSRFCYDDHPEVGEHNKKSGIKQKSTAVSEA